MPRRALRYESLEKRELLSINWVNAATNNFDAIYNTTADPTRGQKAVAIVQRAIADWNAVITNFNYAEDSDADPNNNLNNTYQLTITPGPLGTGTRGEAFVGSSQFTAEDKPKAGTVYLDDNGGGAGWFFDSTPRDDAEFSAVADSFAANFTDVASTYAPFGLFRDDFYRTVVHEIGHALGLSTFVGSAIQGMLSPLYKANGTALKDGVDPSISLKRFQTTRLNPTFGVTATYTSGHLYEGHSSDPATAYLGTTGSSGTNPVAFQSHPNDLMNSGRSAPVGGLKGVETTRQFISDLDAKILADAYGYSVVLPSTLNNAFVSLDEQTGTLLVQGRPDGQNDTISISRSGTTADIIANVNGFTETVPGHMVQRIIVSRNRGVDSISVTGNHPVTGTALATMWVDVQYVVSTNQDLADAGTATRDLLVDHSTAIPGAQISLRSAMLDALAPPAGSPTTTSLIYVPRGYYTLSVPTVGTDDGVAEGDLDITSGNDVTIIGSGPGVTMINGGAGASGTINERVFDVGSGGTLRLERLTVSGGFSPTLGQYGGGIRVNTSAGALLDQVVVTHNSAFSGAGGIWNNGYLSVVRSVIADNTVTQTAAAGAPVWHAGGINSVGTLVLSHSIVANNTASNTNTLGHDVIATTPISGLGYNRIESANSDVITAFNNGAGSPGGVGNYFGAVGAGRIVTSMADVWSADPRAVSLRDVINAANQSATVDDEIWLPAWRFMLTRGRLVDSLGQYSADVSGAANGDIDVADTLALRGVNGSTQIGMLNSQTADRAFELLGDYTRDGIVDGADFFLWQQLNGSTTDLRADGNDDNVVDAADYTAWSNGFGNSLVLLGMSSYNGALLT